MNSVILSKLAEKDIRNIWSYSVEKWGEEHTVQYLTGLNRKLDQLSQEPDTFGVRRPDIKPDYMSCLYERHIVFFKKVNDSIKVIRILHQRMDIERRIR
jgi:toxin ParE1/3/4